MKDANYKERVIGILKEGDTPLEQIAKEIGRSVRHTRRFLYALKADGFVECYQKNRRWLWRLT